MVSIRVAVILLAKTAVACTLFLSSSVNCAEPQSTVSVSVTIRMDGWESASLQSCIYKEIRRLGDIEIFDDGARIRYELVVLRAENRANTHTGYSASAVALDSLSARIAQIFTDNEYKEMLDGTGELTYHVLFQHDTDLTGLCQRLVSDLDVSVLQKIRKDRADFRRSKDAADFRRSIEQMQN